MAQEKLAILSKKYCITSAKNGQIFTNTFNLKRHEESSLKIQHSAQQIMCHLSLFEKSLSLYQSRLMMFLKKIIFKNTNIEQVIVI
jgi:hypothetical protein